MVKTQPRMFAPEGCNDQPGENNQNHILGRIAFPFAIGSFQRLWPSQRLGISAQQALDTRRLWLVNSGYRDRG